MRILGLKARNFLTLGDASLNFDSGLTLIEGVNRDEAYSLSNGAGKSSLIEALYWGLYGRTIREGLKDDVVNWKKGKNCRVEIFVQVDSDLFTITRSRKPNGLTLKKNNGDDLTAHTIKDTERQVADLLKIPPDRFLQTILLEGGMKAAFAHLTDTYRKQFLEEILGLTVWEKFQRASMRMARAAADDIAELRDSISDVKRRIGEEHRRVLDFKESSNGSLVKEAKEQQAKISARLAEIEVEIEKHRKTVKDLEPRELEKELGQWTGQLRQRQQQIAGFRDELAVASNRLDEFSLLLEEGTCPTCEQEVAQADFGPKIVRLKLDVRSLEDKIGGAEAGLQTEQQEYDRIDKLIHEANEGIAVARSQLTSLQRERDVQQDRQQEIIDNLSRVTKAREGAKQMLKERTDELKGHLDGYNRDLAAAREGIEYIEYWRKVAPEIRAGMMRSILDYLNDRLEVYSQIVSDRDEVVQLVLDGNRIVIETQVGGETRKHSMRSSGERRRTDLSIQFSLNDLAVSTGGEVPPILIVDEVLDPLDPVSARRTLELLDKRAQDEGLCVMVTTHNPDTKSGLPLNAGLITVEKQGGTARLV